MRPATINHMKVNVENETKQILLKKSNRQVIRIDPGYLWAEINSCTKLLNISSKHYKENHRKQQQQIKKTTKNGFKMWQFILERIT